MSVKVEETLKFMVEEGSVDPTKIRDFVGRLGTQEIKLLLNFCQKNVSKDLPKRNYGLVHQDLVNILGEKLGFEVTFGDYQKGSDGVWGYEDVKLVVESKTSPTWLEIKQASDYVKDEKATSGLIICPHFTEDNIKAAGGYGNVRLLTADGLCKLTELKDESFISTEDIVNILIPQETVKLDYLVNIIHKIRSKPVEVGEREGPKPLVGQVVAVFPARPDGVEFLLKNSAWGYVRKPSRKTVFLALYVAKPEQSIRYYGKVKSVTPQEKHPSLASDDEEGKYIIELESVEKLENPVPLAEGDLIRGMKYSSLDKLLKAKTTQDLW